MKLGIVKHLSVLSVGGALLLAAGAAFADAPNRFGGPDGGPPPDAEDGCHGRGGGHGMGKLFDRFDTDGDGRVLVKDLPERMRAHLGEADLNHDGALTKDELKGAFKAKREEMKAKADTNHDGMVSDVERENARKLFMKERFAKDDTNGDGAITATEVGERKFAFLAAADVNKDKRITFQEIETAFKNGTLRPPFRRHGGAHFQK